MLRICLLNIILDKDEIYQHLEKIVMIKKEMRERERNDGIHGVPQMTIFGSCFVELI
jgi:hypothetical protein